MQKRLTVVAAQPIAVVGAHAALLRPAGQRLNQAAVRIDPEIAVAQRRRLAGDVRANVAAKQTARAIDPAIEAISKAVDARLVILSAKAGEEHAANIRPIVAVGVFGVENVGSSTDEHALSPH